MRCGWLLLFTLVLSSASHALRCGTELVEEGDFTFQVERKCGRPNSREIIGYTLQSRRVPGAKRERELAIEQWVYGPDSGYFKVLTFEGGRLKRIESVRD